MESGPTRGDPAAPTESLKHWRPITRASDWPALAWTFAHLVTLLFPENPTPAQREAVVAFFTHIFPLFILCGKCYNEYTTHHASSVAGNDRSRDHLAAWLTNVHNEVSQRTGTGAQFTSTDTSIHYQDMRRMGVALRLALDARTWDPEETAHSLGLTVDMTGNLRTKATRRLLTAEPTAAALPGGGPVGPSSAAPRTKVQTVALTGMIAAVVFVSLLGLVWVVRGGGGGGSNSPAAPKDTAPRRHRDQDT